MSKGTDERAILLVGMMGSGKTSVGLALSLHLGWRFIDTDLRVEAEAGCAIAELFRRDGEERFRRIESDVISRLPAERAVIALGGGAICSEQNRSALRSRGTLVWLDASPETLASRLGEGSARPLLADVEGGERVDRLRALREERAESYALAAVLVSTDGLSVEQVRDAVLARLEGGDTR